MTCIGKACHWVTKVGIHSMKVNQMTQKLKSIFRYISLGIDFPLYMFYVEVKFILNVTINSTSIIDFIEVRVSSTLIFGIEKGKR